MKTAQENKFNDSDLSWTKIIATIKMKNYLFGSS